MDSAANDQARIEDFERQMATLMPVIDGASKKVLVEALLGACGTIILLLTNKQASGLIMEFGAAQLAHDFVLDNQDAGAAV